MGACKDVGEECEGAWGEREGARESTGGARGVREGMQGVREGMRGEHEEVWGCARGARGSARECGGSAGPHADWLLCILLDRFVFTLLLHTRIKCWIDCIVTELLCLENLKTELLYNLNKLSVLFFENLIFRFWPCDCGITWCKT